VRERDIRKLLKERVEAYGGEIRAVSWLGRAHAPDVLVLMPGAHFFVETKAPGGKPRPGQLREHDRLRASNCAVFVITTPEELDRWIPPL
jgi:hypothetical protein